MTLSSQLSALNAMSPSELRVVWQEQFRNKTPAIGPDLMKRAIATRLQERCEGSLPLALRKELVRMIARLDDGKELTVQKEIKLKVGTRLVRTWNGKSYHVVVCDDGFEYDGRRFQSLSQIARAITGAHWSGPRFFGLKVGS